jgi:hypothetical protein
VYRIGEKMLKKVIQDRTVRSGRIRAGSESGSNKKIFRGVSPSNFATISRIPFPLQFATALHPLLAINGHGSTKICLASSLDSLPYPASSKSRASP